MRIWSPDHEEQILKMEVPCINGAIADVAWSPDGQRIVAVGEGTDKFGHAFIMDTGTSVGEIGGHNKRITSCDFKPTRPFRVVTGGEDNLVNIHEGPPFKFAGSNKEHTRFVNCVRFAPNGERYVSVGSDSKGLFFDGKTGAKVSELSAAGAHTGSIFSCSWSPDGARLLTASGDKTCKLWDASTMQLISTFNFAERPAVEHMQVGCVWAGSHLLSIGLSGDIFYLDLNNPDRPLRTLVGHQTAVHALAYDPASDIIFSGGSNGQIRVNQVGKGSLPGFGPGGHTNQVTGLAVDAGHLISSARDDSVRTTALGASEFAADKCALSTPPAGVAAAHGRAVTARNGAINVLRGGHSVSELAIKYAPLCVAISPDGTEVAVGGEDMVVHLYSVEAGDALKPSKELSGKHRQHVTALAYSPDGTMLASADAGREIFVWDRSGNLKIEGWVFHTSRVSCLAWAPNSARLASGSLDASVYIWSVAAPAKRVYIKGAHPNGVNSIQWTNDTTIATCGQDALIRTWDIPQYY